MECGKIPSRGTPIFYFAVDPITPDEPKSSRIRTYYVVSHIDSYVEALYFLARHFATPSGNLDAAIERWHTLYSRVFGTVSFENFRKSLMSVPVEHFFLATSEDSARSKAEGTVYSSSMHERARSPPRAAGDDRYAEQRADVDHRRVPERQADHRYAQRGADQSTSRRGDMSGHGPVGGPDPSLIRPRRVDASKLGETTTILAASEEAKKLFAGHEQRRQHSRIVSYGAPVNNDANLNASHFGGGVLTGAPPAQEDARVELHRLKTELADASHVINMERSRAKVNALSDSERAALTYQIDIARKEANEEKARAKENSERLRQMTRNLEERLANLTATHEETLRSRASAEFERLNEVETQFVEREKAMQKEYEQAIHDRDRKLARAVTRVKAFESHLEDALNRVEEQKVKIQELTLKLAESANNMNALEEENKRYKRQLHGLEMQVDDSNRAAARAEDEQRKAETEAAGFKIEVARLRREMERYSQFSHTLHRELQQLDDSAITAAEILRRRVFAARDGSGANPHAALAAVQMMGAPHTQADFFRSEQVHNSAGAYH